MIDEILGSTGITTVLTGVRMPRMNAITERRVKTLHAELLDRTLIWNQTHLRRALGEYERHYNRHRTHRSLAAAAPLRTRPQPLQPGRIERLTIRRQNRLGGIIHEYQHAALTCMDVIFDTRRSDSGRRASVPDHPAPRIRSCATATADCAWPAADRIRRRDRLGGLIHEISAGRMT
jgi:hypothetical protein